LDQLITTIAPAWESTKIDSSRPSGEIGKQLRTILGSGRVLDRAIDRIAFSSDASFYSLIPQAIVQPATLEEIDALFHFSRTQKVPLVFRAGGTSLSGQAITNGVLVDISRYWRMSEVLDDGRAIRVQPGVIGQVANDRLKPYGAKIGPDPASINVARVGGILSNNASGMCCGVTHNAYHTLRSMKLMLPSGTVIDAQNIAHQAVLAGHSVLFITAAQLLLDLAAQDSARALERRFRHYCRPSVLCLDEIGYLSYDARNADLLFQIVSRRYENKSVVMTTNLAFSDWPTIFPNATCATALIDRTVHHADVIAIEGDSYRRREAEADKKVRRSKKVAA